jgi:hypothetical protein
VTRQSRHANVARLSVRTAVDTDIQGRKRLNRGLLTAPNFCPSLRRLYLSAAIRRRRTPGIIRPEQPPSYLKQSRDVFIATPSGANVRVTCYTYNEGANSRYCLQSLVVNMTAVLSHYTDSQADQSLKMRRTTGTFDSSPTARRLTLQAATIHLCGIDQFCKRAKANPQFSMLLSQSVLSISLSGQFGPLLRVPQFSQIVLTHIIDFLFDNTAKQSSG